MPTLKKSALAVLVMSAAFLGACGDKAAVAPAASVQASSQQVSLATLETEARGFSVGSSMSARTVYVFFDAQCPHCSALWEAAKPLERQARFVWIPVGILNASSTSQGAALLASQDPAAAMQAHKESMQAHKGGISALSNLDDQKVMVQNNTALMTRMGFASIPAIVANNARTGQLVSQEGAMQTPALAAFLGLNVPVSSADSTAK